LLTDPFQAAHTQKWVITIHFL